MKEFGFWRVVGLLLIAVSLEAVVLKFNPIFVTSEERIPAVVKALDPPVVKAGQIWEYDDARKDPFRKDIMQFHVVAVKDGYVKYYFVGQEHYGERAAQSEDAGSFLLYKHKVR